MDTTGSAISKPVVASCTAMALAVAAGVIWNRIWLTSSEKKAAIGAMYSIDSVGECGTGAEVAKQTDRARRALAKAHMEAFTRKDKQIAVDLNVYFDWQTEYCSIMSTKDSIPQMVSELDSKGADRTTLLAMVPKYEESMHASAKFASETRIRLAGELE
jgi:hypothetical protein